MVRKRKRHFNPNKQRVPYNDGSLQSMVKPFRFFKIVLPDIFHFKSLRIPDKFANKFGSQFSTGAILKLPTGLSWNVDLTRHDNGQLHLTGQGWVDFMEHNNITCGYFLEFEYQGNTHFTVHIFDLSSSVIDYPIEFDHHPKQKSPLDHKKHVEAEGGQVERNEAKNKVHSADTTLQSIRDSPYFTITVQRYHVIIAGAYLQIPRKFTKDYMGGKLYEHVKLVVDDGREWDLRCNYTASNNIRFTGLQWRIFKRENNWKEGEVYTFTLVNKKPELLVLRVSKQ